MSLMASFCAVLFPRDVLDEIWDLIESVYEGFPKYSYGSVVWDDVAYNIQKKKKKERRPKRCL